MTRSALIAIVVYGFGGVIASFALGMQDEFVAAAAVFILSCAAITIAGSRLLDGSRK